MIIGYSFWGFLGPGIRDTPDGGRSHRRTLIEGLRQRGHRLVFLQPNRDLTEGGHDLTDTYRWDTGLPDIDALFLEWRWRIPGRNTTACGTEGHTCDLHRQQQLLDYYTANGLPTLLWDKDRQLHDTDLLRHTGNVTVCEPALHPSPGAVSLLFPVADTLLDGTDPRRTAATPGLPLLYVGNQYDRDDAFDTFFAPSARQHSHIIAGQWTRTHRWPDLNYWGRIPFTDVQGLYRRALTTVLLLPDRYARVGHMTQRLFESVVAGCLPLTPATIRDAHRFTPPELHITDGAHAATIITNLTRASEAQRAAMLNACLHRLDLFRLSRQLDTIEQVLVSLNAHRVAS